MPKLKLYMAPLKGLTDYIFRSTYVKYFKGFDLAVAPFIASKKDNKIKRKYVKDILPENNSRLTVIPQILSKSAHDFTMLANYIYDLGYETVNWNLGCPSPMVINKMRGSGMLPHADIIDKFLDHVVSKINGTLSIKVRLGLKSSDDIFRLIPIFNQYPIKELIIHPRTGVQRYDGDVDLNAFEQCISIIKHPVVYNGDIKTYEDFKNLSNRFKKVSAWMIGRGCLYNPFLPHIIKSKEDNIKNITKDKLITLKQFHETLFEEYSNVLDGPSHILNKMKGFWQYFSFSFSNHKKTMKQINKSNQPEQYIYLINHFFDTLISK